MHIRLVIITLVTLSISTALAAPVAIPIEQTVVKQRIAEGVSLDDAIESMKLRANLLKLKLVAHLPQSKQIEAMGQKARRMEIFQFCDPLTAQRMVEGNIHFAAHFHCRIAVVEDEKGHGWLVMINPDMMLNGATLMRRPQTKSNQSKGYPARNNGSRCNC